MDTLLPTGLLSTALGLAAYLAMLAVLVQVVQELWKYLRSSKATCYRKLITDFLGPWSTDIASMPGLLDLSVRGPLQFLRLRPRGHVLPVNADDFGRALERNAPVWHQRTLRQLRQETARQTAGPVQPSAGWLELLAELTDAAEPTGGQASEVSRTGDADVSPDDSGEGAEDRDDAVMVAVDWTARELVSFFADQGQLRAPDSGQNGPQGSLLDAKDLLLQFQQRFLPHILEAKEGYPQLLENFNYVYKRRNMRQTFIIGLLLALVANLPFQRLFDEARALKADEAAALAQSVLDNWEEMGCAAEETSEACLTAEDLDSAKELMKRSVGDLSGTGAEPILVTREVLAGLWTDRWTKGIGFLGVCLLTAILLSFGAPFWNDLVGSLSRIGGSPSPPPSQPSPEQSENV